MLGLMQDRPLLISQMIDFAADVLPGRRDRDAAPSRARSTATATRTPPSAPSRWPRRCRDWASSSATGSARWRGTPTATSSSISASPASARCCTPSTRASRPSTSPIIANHAEDQVIFVDLNLLPIVEGVWPHLKTVKHVVVMTDRAHMPAASKIPEAAVLRGADRRQAGHAQVAGRSTRRRRRRSATPRARPAIPRACSTRTARRSSTP